LIWIQHHHFCGGDDDGDGDDGLNHCPEVGTDVGSL